MEVGASPQETLLTLPALQQADELVGINLEHEKKFGRIKIIRGDANSMDMFEDESFETVLCNAMLEHDPNFWKTIAEMKRVIKPGGLLVVGVPSFVKSGLNQWIKRLSFWRKGQIDVALTYGIHEAPGDYYRFSPMAVKDILLADFQQVEMITLMTPPRAIGYGIKPERVIIDGKNI